MTLTGSVRAENPHRTEVIKHVLDVIFPQQSEKTAVRLGEGRREGVRQYCSAWFKMSESTCVE